MSAAATAAGYLYASGRLRGRNDRGRDEHGHEHGHDEHGHHEHGHDHEQRPAQKPRRQVKVAVYQPEPQPGADARPKKTPKIEYRTRRWRPE
jgi:hypothetical protein